jgi:hypothetical protein
MAISTGDSVGARWARIPYKDTPNAHLLTSSLSRVRRRNTKFVRTIGRARHCSTTTSRAMSVHTPVYMNNQLFGCTDDVGDCLYACFCGPCHVGSIAQRTGTGDCFGTCCINNIANMVCPWIGGIVHGGSVFKSALLRVGVTAPLDTIACICCFSCLQCQVSREINDRQAAAAANPQAGAPQPQVIVVQAPPAQVVYK